MNVDLYNAILEKITKHEHDTIYSMYCEEFELPDSLDTDVEKSQLQLLLYRMLRCLENAQENLLFYEKFKNIRYSKNSGNANTANSSQTHLSASSYFKNQDKNSEKASNVEEKAKNPDFQPVSHKTNVDLKSFENNVEKTIDKNKSFDFFNISDEDSDDSDSDSVVDANDDSEHNNNDVDNKNDNDENIKEGGFKVSYQTRSKRKNIIIGGNASKKRKYTKNPIGKNTLEDKSLQASYESNGEDENIITSINNNSLEKGSSSSIKTGNKDNSSKSSHNSDDGDSNGDSDSREENVEEFKQRNSMFDKQQQEKMLEKFGTGHTKQSDNSISKEHCSGSTTKNPIDETNLENELDSKLQDSSAVEQSGPGEKPGGVASKFGKKKKHKNPNDKFQILSRSEMRCVMDLEMKCVEDLESVIAKYLIEHYTIMKKNFVYFCPKTKINKSILLIEQAFIVISKCKIMTSIWRSINLKTKIYESKGSDFEFVRHFKLCYSKEKIQDYTVNELICSLRLIGEHFFTLHYTTDLEIYIELLFTRCSFICCYAYQRNIHNVCKYRKKIMNTATEDSDNGEELYVPSKRFILDMSVFFYSFRKMLENRSMFNTVTMYGLDHMFNKKHSEKLVDFLGKCTSSIKLKNFDPQIHYNRSLLDDTYYLTNDLRDNEVKSVKTFSHIFKKLGFRIESLDHLKLCFFVNDEIVKFYSEANIAFKIYQWFQSKTDTIEDYGEAMMKKYFKMCLTFDMYVGEDQLFVISTNTANKTIENAIRTSRGLMVFNKIQEASQKRAQEILPDPSVIFTDFKNIYDKQRFSTIINLRFNNPQMHNEGLGNDTVTKKEKIEFEKMSKINNNLAEFMMDKNTLFYKSFFTVKQNIFCIKIIAAFFQNQYKIDFECRFVIYFKEIHEQYEAFTRSKYPFFIQTFNAFNIYYQNNVYELENFMCAFYVWLRLLDKFHDSKIEGISIDTIYQVVFKNTDFYNEKCRKSYQQIIQQQIDDKNDRIKQKKEQEKEERQQKKTDKLQKTLDIKDQPHLKRKRKKKIKIDF